MILMVFGEINQYICSILGDITLLSILFCLLYDILACSLHIYGQPYSKIVQPNGSCAMSTDNCGCLSIWSGVALANSVAGNRNAD